VSNNSRPLFLSRTSSLEPRKGDRDCLRLRSWLRSRDLSPPCCDRGLDLTGLRSLALGSLSLSRRRGAGDRDLLGRVTPRSTLPRSLRSSPWLQLSFIATYRAGECCVKEGIALPLSRLKCCKPRLASTTQSMPLIDGTARRASDVQMQRERKGRKELC